MVQSAERQPFKPVSGGLFGRLNDGLGFLVGLAGHAYRSSYYVAGL